MISNALLKFAAAHDWHAADDEKYVFGKFNGYCFTAKTQDALSSYIVPLAGISPEDLLDLSKYIEESHFSLKLVDYEMTDNFLSLRAKDTLFNSTAKQIERFLTQLTEKLQEYELNPQNCIICGKAAETESLYVGLYAYTHPECLDKEGIDYTAAFNADAKDSEEFLLLQRDENGEDLLAYDLSTEEDLMLPDTDKLAALAAEMDTYSEDLIRDLTELCAVPSVKGTATEDAPFGQATVDALAVFLRQAETLGFRIKNLDNMAGYAEYGPEDASDMVACVCHLDVVPAGDGWTGDPWQLRREDGKLIARGVSDDKGPALAALYAAKALMDDVDFEPGKRIRIIVGLDEESGSACMDHYVKHEEIPEMGFTADADFPAIYAEKGIARLRFTIPRMKDDVIRTAKAGSAVNMVPSSCRIELKDGSSESYDGVTAHGSRPDLGVNAINTAVDSLLDSGHEDSFVSFYNNYFSETDGSALGLAFEDESGSTTVNAGLLDIDEEQAEVIVDVRYPVYFDLKAALENLDESLSREGVALKMQDHMEPLYLPKDSPLIRTLMDVYNEGTGTEGRAVAIGGGTYARSIPNICAYGPAFPGDEDVAHQANEWITVEKLLAASTIYRNAFRKLATK
ncbi:MAG: Sapep family Mn(2+)-dependent dipeptidase [Eubacteriales bacterium]|nr:Sapep family Mn(2+)-dependent dipeptidase [Eubacteriales bacterium]